MKEQTRALLTMQGTLSSISRVSEYLDGMIMSGNTELEQKIIDSGKTINDCWKYVTHKAKELAGSDNEVCIDDETVFGWAVHYYEDNELAEKELSPTPKATTSSTSTSKTTTTKTTKSKSKTTKKTYTPKAETKGFTPMTDEEWDNSGCESKEDIDFLLGDDFDESEVPF